MKFFFPVGLILCVFLVISSQAYSSDRMPKAGDTLPDYIFKPPLTDEEKKYLAVEGKNSFSLKELEADFFLIEITGVYCPICHMQSEQINQLFNMISRDKELSEKMLMFSVVSGATDGEIEYLRETWQAPYPMLPDYEYDFFNAVGSPGVPFTLIVSRDSAIHYSNQGRMPELSSFSSQIRAIISGQGE